MTGSLINEWGTSSFSIVGLDIDNKPFNGRIEIRFVILGLGGWIGWQHRAPSPEFIDCLAELKRVSTGATVEFGTEQAHPELHPKINQ